MLGEQCLKYKVNTAGQMDFQEMKGQNSGVGWNIRLLPLIFIVSQKQALLWRLQAKPLRVDQDV